MKQLMLRQPNNNNKSALLILLILFVLVALACAYGCSNPKTITKTVTRDSIVYVKQTIHDTTFVEKTVEAEAKSTVESSTEHTFDYTILALNDSGELRVKEKGTYHYTGTTKKDSTSYYKDLYQNLFTQISNTEQNENYASKDSVKHEGQVTEDKTKFSMQGAIISIILLCSVVLALYLCNKALKDTND